MLHEVTERNPGFNCQLLGQPLRPACNYIYWRLSIGQSSFANSLSLLAGHFQISVGVLLQNTVLFKRSWSLPELSKWQIGQNFLEYHCFVFYPLLELQLQNKAISEDSREKPCKEGLASTVILLGSQGVLFWFSFSCWGFFKHKRRAPVNICSFILRLYWTYMAHLNPEFSIFSTHLLKLEITQLKSEIKTLQLVCCTSYSAATSRSISHQLEKLAVTLGLSYSIRWVWHASSGLLKYSTKDQEMQYIQHQ